MVSTIYDNDRLVGELTRAAFNRTDSRLLQIHRFSADENEHVATLLETFDPPSRERIADVGCGVGRLAEMMQARRPDLDFTLINRSASQLAMCPDGFKTALGTAEQLPLVPGEADAILVTYVLGHVELDKFISECVRVDVARVYVFDIFKFHFLLDCRLQSDLGYTERTEYDTNQAFLRGGFHLSRSKWTDLVPNEIFELMPNTNTLENTMSAAMTYDAGR